MKPGILYITYDGLMESLGQSQQDPSHAAPCL